MSNLTVREQDLSGRHATAVAKGLEAQPAPVPSAKSLTPEQQAVMERVQHKADVIRDVAFPAAMAAAVPVAKDIGTAAFKLYRDELIEQAGSPSDPIEIMLIEQLTLAHHRVAQLHVQAEQAKMVEESKIFTMAAVRLTGELRRLALALSQYRQPMSRRQFTLIKQQNVARGRQQVAYIDRDTSFSPKVPYSDRGAELESNSLPQIRGDDPADRSNA
jgi:hypothetical protein